MGGARSHDLTLHDLKDDPVPRVVVLVQAIGLRSEQERDIRGVIPVIPVIPINKKKCLLFSSWKKVSKEGGDDSDRVTPQRPRSVTLTKPSEDAGSGAGEEEQKTQNSLLPNMPKNLSLILPTAPESLDNLPVVEPSHERHRRDATELAKDRSAGLPIGHIEHFFGPSSSDHDAYSIALFRGGHIHFLCGSVACGISSKMASRLAPLKPRRSTKVSAAVLCDPSILSGSPGWPPGHKPAP